MPDSFETDNPIVDEKPTSLSFKVGEREYDADTAAKKISAADEHIRKIEEENATLRANAEASAKLEEALAKLEAMQAGDRKPSDLEPDKPVDIASIVEEKLAAMLSERETASEAARRKQLAEQTFKATQEALAAKFGDNVDVEVKAKAAEIGISFEKAIRMAADPEESKILLRLLGTNPAKTSSMPASTLTAPASPDNRSKEQTLVQTLRTSGRSRERTQAFRELAAEYSSPEKLAELRAKWEDLHH